MLAASGNSRALKCREHGTLHSGRWAGEGVEEEEERCDHGWEDG